MSTARVDFTRGAAERIANVVRIVEQGERDLSGPVFDRADPPPFKVFRMCTFTGAWSINGTKVVTFRNVTTTPNTVLAINLFAQVAVPSPSPGACAIARDGTAWYVIAAQCE